MEDVSKYPDLFATLLADPSWTEDDVKKLAGGNLLRVFSAVEEVHLHFPHNIISENCSLFKKIETCMAAVVTGSRQVAVSGGAPE